MKRVFHGLRYRVQLTVYDWSEEIEYYRDKGWEHRASELEQRGTSFYVAVLSQSAHSSTAFARGRNVYGGKEFGKARKAIEQYVGPIVLPPSLKKYQQKEG